MHSNQKTCCNCVLHTSVPGVTVHEDGLCSICANYKKFQPHEPKMGKYLLTEMENMFESVKKRGSLFHVIVLFSGGKDSTFLLKMAKEKYGLRPLAFSVIHPLINDKAKKNMEDVARKLNVELIKVYLDEEAYKKCIRLGILKGTEYGLGEFFGCDICSFFHHWIPIRFAMRMGIPIILEGSTISQTSEITFHQAERVKAEAQKGKKPFGRVHDVVMDALGEKYRGSIYDYDEAEVLEGKYPTIISPFSFIDYDYRGNFEKIESMGLKSKDFHTIYTNCSATPFFSYYTLKRFDCVSYIKHYATEVRRGYPNLMQYIAPDKQDPGVNIFNKETVEKLMEEYRLVVLYIVEQRLNNDNITEPKKEKMKRMAPTYMNLFGEEVCDIFLRDALMIPYYADFFGVDLHNLE